MALLRKMLIALVLGGVVLALTPVLFPYDRFKPGLETAMKSRLEADAQIGDITFSYSPKPQLQLSGITLGAAGEGSIGRATIPISLRNLLHFRRELSEVALEDVVFKQAFALSLPGRLKPNPNGRDIHIASVDIKNLSIKLQKDTVGPLSAVMAFRTDGTFRDITFADATGRAQVLIKPVGDKFSLLFEASNWVLPGKYAVRFDNVTVRGMADEQGIMIDDINAMVFGSPALGQAQLSWGSEWRLKGSLETKSMFAEPMVTLFSPITYSTGRVAAFAEFEFLGTGYEDLFKQFLINTKFTITDGKLHNFDLVAPLRSQNPSSIQRGGQTRFDSLSGTALIDATGVQLGQLALNAGKFNASGSMGISPEMKLAGKLAARLNSGAIAVEAPLAIRGTLEAPEIVSAGAYKPGDAASTTRVF